MLKAILCPIWQAKQPFHLKSVDMDFFSLEELFYYYVHNEILIDESIMDEEFVYWVRKELGQEALAEKLHQQIGAKCSITMFLGTLLGQINTMEETEKEEFLKHLSQMENKNELQKRKILADQMAERGKYEAALIEYRRIIQAARSATQEDNLLAGVWHNLGCCYGRMLEFEQAMECFQTAYSYVPARESRMAVTVLQQLQQEEEKSLPVEGKDRFILEGNGKEKRQIRYQQLKERMKDYLRSTR